MLKTIQLLAMSGLLWFPIQLSSQTNAFQTITAQVVDNFDHEPLIGVTIRVEGENRGAITDLNGYFSLSVNGDEILDFSYTGYGLAFYSVDEVKLNLGNKIELHSDALLPEVVITGQAIWELKGYTIYDYIITLCDCLQSPDSIDIQSTALPILWNYYPNPTIDGITVQTNDLEGRIKLFSVDGRLISQTAINGPTTRIDMSWLPASNYLLFFENKDIRSPIGQVSLVKL